MLAAASHLSNALDFRKPSDVAFTATLSNRESIRSEDVRILRFGALPLDNSTGHLVEPEWELLTPEKRLISCHYALPHGFVIFTANMLQNVYRIG